MPIVHDVTRRDMTAVRQFSPGWTKGVFSPLPPWGWVVYRIVDRRSVINPQVRVSPGRHTERVPVGLVRKLVKLVYFFYESALTMI